MRSRSLTIAAAVAVAAGSLGVHHSTGSTGAGVRASPIAVTALGVRASPAAATARLVHAFSGASTPRHAGHPRAGSLLARAGRAPAQAGLDLQAADALVAGWVDAGRIPGAVLLVSRDGEVLLERAYGHAWLDEYADGQYGAAAAGESRPTAIRRLDDPVPMTTGTIFDVASVTKVVATTFAVMLLVDDGELELDARVHEVLPDFRGGGKERITLRQLLTHRSGLQQWQPLYYRASNAAEAYEAILDLPLGWSPGEGRHYSDLGFMVLGLVVEEVAGRSLDAFLEDRLYGPLGLESTGFRPAEASASPGPDDSPPPGRSPPGRPPSDTSPSDTSPSGRTSQPGSGLRPREGPFAATSHGNPYEHRMVHDPGFGYLYEGDPDAWDGWRRRTLVGEVNDGNAYHAFRGVAGHAGLFSTAADLQVLIQLLLDRGEHDGRRILSPEVIDEFLAPTGDGQALGWQLPDHLPPGSFAHPGFTGTYVLGVPAEGIAVVLLTNRQNLGVGRRGRYPDLTELQDGVARAVVGS